MKNLVLLILISFLFSCNQPAKQNIIQDIPKTVVYITPAGDKIVFLEDYYKLYLKAIKKNYPNRFRIYEEQVQDSIFNKYFSKCEYAELTRKKLASPIRDTTGLRIFIAKIDSSHVKIEELITAALAESKKYLKNDSITVYVIPSSHDVGNMIEGMGGVMGFTSGSKQIILTLDLVRSAWQEHLQDVIAHEFNYTYWTKMNFKTAQWTLLNYLISEGRADSYAHLIYPDVKHPWTNTLTEKQETDLWNRIRSQLNNRDVAYQYNVMFGVRTQYLYPLWGGYTLGYDIVQSALKNHPELTPEQWSNLSPEKILEMSDYKL